MIIKGEFHVVRIHAIKACRGSRGISPIIIELGFWVQESGSASHFAHFTLGKCSLVPIGWAQCPGLGVVLRRNVRYSCRISNPVLGSSSSDLSHFMYIYRYMYIYIYIYRLLYCGSLSNNNNNNNNNML
jgi:hypothetical protein